MTVNCAVECVNGCILGDQCPHLEHVKTTAQFINDTPLDKLLAIAEEAVRKKALGQISEPPKWVLPDEPF